MMKFRFFSIILFSIVVSCGRMEKSPVQPEVEPATDTTASYFPVADFLRSEIKQVDSLPVGIKFYRTIQGETDSGYLDRAEFRRLSQEFLPAELNEDFFQNNFKENTFFDSDIQRSVFNYLPSSDANNIRRVDVLSKEGDVYSKVTGVYIERSDERNDSSIISKMMWTPGSHFMINSQQSDKSGNSTISNIRVVWSTGTVE